jgi:hypothetical protein
VVDKLRQFTNTSNEQKAINNYVANLKWGGNLKTTSRGVVKKSGIKDFADGRQAAAGVQIQHGVEGKKHGAMLIENSQQPPPKAVA